jgi:serine/threonine-protein kinase RsbT
MSDVQRFSVTSRADVERSRREARILAASLGFGRMDAEMVALAVSELATNLARYASGGEIDVGAIHEGSATGLRIESHDTGPGISNLGRAMEDGFSTGGGLGSGLPSVRRLMDDFAIESGPEGTRVVVCKWLRTGC